MARVRPKLHARFGRALLFLLLSTGATSSCATVQPWERGALSQSCMEAEMSELSAVNRRHAFSVREGAGLATGSTGGGCGCN